MRSVPVISGASRAPPPTRPRHTSTPSARRALTTRDYSAAALDGLDRPLVGFVALLVLLLPLLSEQAGQVCTLELEALRCLRLVAVGIPQGLTHDVAAMSFH